MAINLRKRSSINYCESVEPMMNTMYDDSESDCDVTRGTIQRNRTAGRKLRQRARISYYEPEEPAFDQYEFCEECGDYAFEYCAIHGPLLVIPDDKVCSKRQVAGGGVVPRAALTIPHVFLHLAPSIIAGAGVGVFASLTLPRGVRFGPYRGQRAHSPSSMYCWQIYDAENRRSHVLDAEDPQHSNWMRYVNCARHWNEQNLVAYQYQGQMYYKTNKIIPRFTELLVFYGGEYANTLNINLAKYNCPQYYEDVIHSACMESQTIEDSNISSGSNESASNTQHYIVQNNYTETSTDEQLFNFNEFQIIDEDQSVQIDESLPQHNLITLHFNELNDPEVEVVQSEENNYNPEQIRFQCDKCDRHFANKRYLRSHYKRHSEATKYQCTQCSYSTPYKYPFTRHCKGHSNRKTYNCDLCLFKTDIKSHWVRHNFQHNMSHNAAITGSYYSKAKQCGICQFETFSRKSYQTHVQKHRGSVYQCQLCEYKSYSKCYLSQHITRKHGYKK